MTTITATEEQQSSTQVPKQLYIGGEWRDGAKGTLSGRGPVDRRVAVRGRRRVRRRRQGRARRRRRGRTRVGRAPAARARRDPPPRVRGDHRARRRAGAADDARDGQAGQGVEGRDRLRRRVPALVLRGGGPDRRPLRGRPERPGPAADDAAAGRAVPADHAVELPAGDGHPQDRARRSPPAARWSSSPPSRRRCRC